MARYFQTVLQTYVTNTGVLAEAIGEHDSTAESHTIVGVREVGDKDYNDFEIADGPVDNLYLLYGIYGTGDSFGRDEGRFEGVMLHRCEKTAEENARRLQEHYGAYRELDCRGLPGVEAYGVDLVSDDGQVFRYSPPWIGYFECLDFVEVERVGVVK